MERENKARIEASEKKRKKAEARLEKQKQNNDKLTEEKMKSF